MSEDEEIIKSVDESVNDDTDDDDELSKEEIYRYIRDELIHRMYLYKKLRSQIISIVLDIGKEGLYKRLKNDELLKDLYKAYEPFSMISNLIEVLEPLDDEEDSEE